VLNGNANSGAGTMMALSRINLHLVAERYAFEAEVSRGAVGAALLTAYGSGDGKLVIGQSM